MTTQVMLRFRSSVHDTWLTNPELRGRLVAAAEERGSNVTDIIIESLSLHYGVEYDLTGRKSTADPDADKMTVRIPTGLYDVIDASLVGRRPKPTMPDEILRVLCVRLDLEHSPAAVPA